MERVKQRQSAAEEQPVVMKGNGTEEEKISFVAEFKYLGFLFRCDGDRWGHVEQRLMKATAAFGRLGHIWRDASLSKGLKLRIYSTYVVSVLAWGVQAWPFAEKHRKKIRQWNAKMMVKLLGAGQEADWGAAVRSQHRNPEVDLVGILRSRRLNGWGTCCECRKRS